jgi:phage-related tail fiber protein
MATIPSNELLMWAGADVNLPNLAGPNKVKPISDLILKGWDFKQKPAADEFNYILNNYAQWIEYLTDYVDEIVISGATGDAASAGMIGYFARNSAPVGYLKANGAAINATTYANLATAIYVGDTLNPTALFGYKCTDPLNPTTTRSISGDYIVIPDLRGEFIRGWDDSRGIDAGREFGSVQKGTLVGGYDNDNAGTDIGFLPNKTTRSYGGDTIKNPSEYGVTEVIWSGSVGTRVSWPIESVNYWYTITRPRNIALLACIKY